MTEFATATYEPKRKADREAELTDRLAFSTKVSDGLLATIDRQDRLIANLQGELAELRADSINVLRGVRK